MPNKIKQHRFKSIPSGTELKEIQGRSEFKGAAHTSTYLQKKSSVKSRNTKY
jgi:hypothetical protein